MRAKTIEIKKSEIILSRRFLPISCALKPENIESYSLEKRSDSNIYSTFVNNYQLIQIKTFDGKFHYFLSYEIKQFDSLGKWLKSKKIHQTQASTIQICKSEYGLPFLIPYLQYHFVAQH